MSCGVGHRHSPDLALLWLWYRPAATALIQPLAWEPSKKKKIVNHSVVYLKHVKYCTSTILGLKHRKNLKN